MTATLTWAELATRYEGRAPRYTSYPTAVQFSEQVDAQTYAGWIDALDPHKPIGLYVHVPFCEQLCWFCGCNTRAVRRRESVVGYLDHLEIELALLERRFDGRPRVNALHLGGGTPNMLSRDDLTRLFGLLRHVFTLTPHCAIAVEMDPGVLTQSWVRAAAFHGLVRASLGVQDLSPHVQKAVNRKLEFDQLRDGVGWLRDCGVESINLDLMYGLPLQTAADVLSTIDQVLALKPERLALFGYAHVPWLKAHQRMIVATDLPGAAERLEQAETAADRLVAEGYVRIGLDHFALPGDELAKAAAAHTLHRNFQGYTSDPLGALIGIGPSAIGALPQGYVQNLTSEAQWRTALQGGRLPTARGVEMTAEDRFRGAIIERLMCDLEVDLLAVAHAHGRCWAELRPAVDQLRPMLRDGLLETGHGRVVVTERGRPFVRSVCVAFDAYLMADGQPRHAAAV